eukprot:gene1173-1889_t
MRWHTNCVALLGIVGIAFALQSDGDLPPALDLQTFAPQVQDINLTESHNYQLGPIVNVSLKQSKIYVHPGEHTANVTIHLQGDKWASVDDSSMLTVRAWAKLHHAIRHNRSVADFPYGYMPDREHVLAPMNTRVSSD